MKVFQFPLTKITIGFVMGIIWAYHLKLETQFVIVMLIISICAFFIVYFISKTKTIHFIYFGTSTYLLSFLFGIATQIVHTESNQKTNYIHNTALFEKPHLIQLVVREKLKSSIFNDRYIALVNRIGDSIHSGKILLNIRKDSTLPPIEIGSNLQLYNQLVKNSSPKNPNQFDYGKYLDDKQIYAQLYTSYSDIKKGSFMEKDVWYYTSKLRTKMIRNLERNDFNKRELNVVIALILGQQQDISPDIIRDYQYAGAIHILSVSGLHVGFILVFVTFLLKPLPNTKRGSFIKLIIILLSLFSFGIMAGLSPSVLRSVTMFSFVAIGMYLRRNTDVFHTLLVSALLILLCKPSFLFDVGFQLSYLALFFILWLQPVLDRIWTPKNKILDGLWKIFTVSVAAQIGAFPLCIYYFHQFPGLFFVTNLLVLPFLSLLMALGVIVLSLAAFDWAPLWLCKALEWSIYFMNKAINWIASFEGFVFRDIPFSIYLLWAMYLLIFSTILWFKKPSFNRLFITLLMLILFQITFLATHWSAQRQKELIVFHSKKETIITQRKGENSTLFSSQSILKTASDNKTINTYLLANFSHLKSKKELTNFLFFNNKKILVLDSSSLYSPHWHPDIVLLTQSPKINLSRLIKELHPTQLVADRTNYKSYVERWKQTCKKEKIPFHAIDEKGFYRLK